MPIEIERRFLIGNDNWRQYADEPLLLRQGYLSVEKNAPSVSALPENRRG